MYTVVYIYIIYNGRKIEYDKLTSIRSRIDYPFSSGKYKPPTIVGHIVYSSDINTLRSKAGSSENWEDSFLYLLSAPMLIYSGNIKEYFRPSVELFPLIKPEIIFTS